MIKTLVLLLVLGLLGCALCVNVKKSRSRAAPAASRTRPRAAAPTPAPETAPFVVKENSQLIAVPGRSAFVATVKASESPQTEVACRLKDNWMSCRFKHLSYDVLSSSFFINCCGSNCNFPQLSKLKLLGRDIPRQPDLPVKCYGDKLYSSVRMPNRKVILLAKRFSPQNGGHVLMESVYPLQMLAMDYSYFNRSERVLLLHDDCYDGLSNSHYPRDTITWTEGGSQGMRDRCSNLTFNIMAPLADGAMYTYHDIEESHKRASGMSTGVLTFEQDVLAGIGGISSFPAPKHMPKEKQWTESKFAPVVDSFLNDVRSFHKVKVQQHHNPEKQNTKMITFLYKYGRRSVLNWQELDAGLAELARSRNERYFCLNLNDVSFRKQLSVLAKTTTLVTVGGSTSFSSFFLTPSKTTKLIYFPLWRLNVEIQLFKAFPSRWNFISYAMYAGYWWIKHDLGPVALDVVPFTEDKSYTVDVDIVKYLVDPSFPPSFNRGCPQLKFHSHVDRFLDSANMLVKQIPIDLNFGVKPYFVGSESAPEATVKEMVAGDSGNMKLYSSWWKQHKREGGVALDLGANRGLYTYFFAAMGLSQIFSFEIDTLMFKELQHGMFFNSLDRNRVRLNFLGISHNNTQMKEIGSGDSGYLAPSSQNESNMLVMTLDCWSKSTNFKQKTIDLVKIDIEGFEAAALLGAHDTLFDSSVTLGALLVEIGPTRWPRSGTQFGTGVSVLRELSKKFLRSSIILGSNDKSCPETIKDGLNLQEWSSDGVVLHAFQDEVWIPLLKKMILKECESNFWFSN